MQQLLFSKDYAVGTKLFLISQLNLNLLQINSVLIISRGVIVQRISIYFLTVILTAQEISTGNAQQQKSCHFSQERIS